MSLPVPQYYGSNESINAQMQMPQEDEPQPQVFPQFSSKKYDNDFTKWQYESADILEDIESFLRGQIRDENGEYQQKYTPLIAKDGINILMGDLRFHLNKNVFLSNLDAGDVRRLAKETRLMIVRWLYLNWFKYKIDKANLDRIVIDIDHIIYCALKKPLNDLERQHVHTGKSRIESVNIDQVPKQKRFGIF